MLAMSLACLSGSTACSMDSQPPATERERSTARGRPPNPGVSPSCCRYPGEGDVLYPAVVQARRAVEACIGLTDIVKRPRSTDSEFAERYGSLGGTGIVGLRRRFA